MATATDSVSLPPTAPVDEAMALVQSGKWSLAEFKAWDASRNHDPKGDRKPKAKTTCDLTYERFKTNAGKLAVDFGGATLYGTPKLNQSGSFGWYVNGKFNIVVDGVEITFQVGANCTVGGSKPAGSKDE